MKMNKLWMLGVICLSLTVFRGDCLVYEKELTKPDISSLKNGSWLVNVKELFFTQMNNGSTSLENAQLTVEGYASLPIDDLLSLTSSDDILVDRDVKEADLGENEDPDLRVTVSSGTDSYIINLRLISRAPANHHPLIVGCPQLDCKLEFDIPNGAFGFVPEVKLTINDIDLGANGEVKVSLEDGKTPFGLMKEGNEYQLLALNKEEVFAGLDFDEDTYNLKLVACDHGVPPLCSNASLLLNVIKNKHSPVFSNDQYTITVAENRPQQEFKVVASDGDSEPFNTITYEIVGKCVRFIEIDTLTGVGKLIEVPPRKHERVCLVRATDQGPGTKKSTTAEIKVILPVYLSLHITTQLEMKNNTIFVDELMDVRKKAIAQANIEDQSKIAKDFTLSVEPSEVFMINPIGRVFFREEANAEKRRNFEVEVKACTKQKLNHTETCKSIGFKIWVTDADEFLPEFKSPDSYEVSVTENKPIGSPIVRTEAFDRDVDSTNVVYQLTGKDAVGFKINEITGEVFLAAALDYERKKSYSLTVLASSSGKTSQAEVNVIVVNVNDNSPKFVTPSTNGTIYNVYYDQTKPVFTLKATDLDGDVITYKIDDEPSVLEGKIKVSAKEGEVFLTSTTDELTRVTVQACDGGNKCDKVDFSIKMKADHTALLVLAISAVFAFLALVVVVFYVYKRRAPESYNRVCHMIMTACCGCNGRSYECNVDANQAASQEMQAQPLADEKSEGVEKSVEAKMAIEQEHLIGSHQLQDTDQLSTTSSRHGGCDNKSAGTPSFQLQPPPHDRHHVMSPTKWLMLNIKPGHTTVSSEHELKHNNANAATSCYRTNQVYHALPSNENYVTVRPHQSIHTGLNGTMRSNLLASNIPTYTNTHYCQPNTHYDERASRSNKLDSSSGPSSTSSTMRMPRRVSCV